MVTSIGFIFTLVIVLGVYGASGGNMHIIIHALPIELSMILGASIGAYVVSNKAEALKGSLKDIKMCFKGGVWTKQDYQDLLCLMFSITKLVKTKGLLALEEHIEKPQESSLFSAYPKIVHDHFACDFICDTLRIITLNLEDAMQIEDYMQRLLNKHHHEAEAGPNALQGMADGMPAIGIVAAVLGVIKTMGSIDKPPTVLGGMIAGALVGTFMGVFLSYCFIGPLASRAKALHEQDAQFYYIIRDVMVSHLKGNAPQISVEIGRGNVPSQYQPSFAAMEEAINNIGK